MAGLIPPPRDFVDWLQLMMTSKSGWIFSDFAESWLAGAKMLLRTGTTTVGDIEMAPELLPDIWTATPLRVISFLEMTGVKSKRPPSEIVSEALEKIASTPGGRERMGLSPHSPYSTLPELLRLAADAGKTHHVPIVTHVAESDQEQEMFMHGRGKMFDWLRRNGRDMGDCGLGSPVQHLERNGLLGKNLLAVHANYLTPEDIARLAKHKVSVVHCPRSHSYFKHRKFSLNELAAAGINVCLGTDSLASIHKSRKETAELNMFEEMRELAADNPDLKPDAILQMATVNGARALGLGGHAGEISPGMFADMIAVPFVGKISEASTALVHGLVNVAASMIDGHWAIAPCTGTT